VGQYWSHQRRARAYEDHYIRSDGREPGGPALCAALKRRSEIGFITPLSIISAKAVIRGAITCRAMIYMWSVRKDVATACALRNHPEDDAPLKTAIRAAINLKPRAITLITHGKSLDGQMPRHMKHQAAGLDRVRDPFWYRAWVLASRCLIPLPPAQRPATDGQMCPCPRGREHAVILPRRCRPRPDGKLVWVHAASVAESLSVLALNHPHGHMLPDAQFPDHIGHRALGQAGAQRRAAARVHQFRPLGHAGPL